MNIPNPLRVFSLRSKTVKSARLRRQSRRVAPLLTLLIVVGQLVANYTHPSDYGSRAQMVRGMVATGRGATRPFGMGPWQYACFLRACKKANVSPVRVVQTIGNARLSAGFHAQDGVAHEGDFYPYCAATDLSVRDLTRPQIDALLSALFDAGFIGWYRHTGVFAGVRHIHIVFVGYPMKEQLARQVSDALHDLTGLVGHKPETTSRLLSAKQKLIIAAMFAKCSAKSREQAGDGE